MLLLQKSRSKMYSPAKGPGENLKVRNYTRQETSRQRNLPSSGEFLLPAAVNPDRSSRIGTSCLKISPATNAEVSKFSGE
ncbi:hypothetical protein C4K39_5150 [Pseudomonas sessilinigenes]|nr:hypothetical protein C4K39_5150 [Pseudomonas sessilinigenes]